MKVASSVTALGACGDHRAAISARQRVSIETGVTGTPGWLVHGFHKVAYTE